MKKQKVRRLTLHRETLKQLDNPSLHVVAGMSSQCSFVCCPIASDTCGTA